VSVVLEQVEPFAAPLVDRLSVRVVVDSAYDLCIEDSAHPMVKIEHVRRILGHERATFAGEWGLSLYLEAAQAGGRPRHLLDFGYAPEVLVRNFALLDLDPGAIARYSFERLLDSTLIEPAEAQLDHFTEAERLGRLVPDCLPLSASLFVAASAHQRGGMRHSRTPRRSATAKISLSPRPHKFMTRRWSRGSLGAILPT
jgi:hypothetical protein